MKFFHLSDLHIGKQLHHYNLREDQEYGAFLGGEGLRVNGAVEAEYLLQLCVQKGIRSGKHRGHDRGHGLIGGGQGGSAGGQSSPVINQLKVEVSQQVNIQVRVVEVSRSLTHSLGFNWGAVLNTGRGPLFLGNGTSQGLFSSHASNNSHFNPDGSFEDGAP